MTSRESFGGRAAAIHRTRTNSAITRSAIPPQSEQSIDMAFLIAGCSAGAWSAIPHDAVAAGLALLRFWLATIIRRNVPVLCYLAGAGQPRRDAALALSLPLAMADRHHHDARIELVAVVVLVACRRTAQHRDSRSSRPPDHPTMIRRSCLVKDMGFRGRRASRWSMAACSGCLPSPDA